LQSVHGVTDIRIHGQATTKRNAYDVVDVADGEPNGKKEESNKGF
jgi:hypothetical protein